MLPKSIVNNVKMYYGKEGETWISNFDSHLNFICKKYNLEIIKPYNNLSINYVAKVKLQSKKNVVLKLGFPSNEFVTEANALKHFKSNSFINLIEASPKEGVLLLEEVVLGEPLSILENDREATKIASNLMKNIWKEVENEKDYPDLNKWFEAFSKIRERYNGETGPFDNDLFNLAENIKDDLLKSISKKVLLHGDLHHFNILKGKDSWVIIDPKGVIGEREYELAPFFQNPNDKVFKKENVTKIFEERLEIFTEVLNLNKDRVIKWAFVHSILSSLWNVDGPKQSWIKSENWGREISKLI